MRAVSVLLTSFLVSATASLAAQVDARMFRFPDISASQIAFVYAGDIWVVAKEGGTANRLSSPRGQESFPRFSPDGTQIAYSANYDGNTDVYVIPAAGGAPVRVTHHPMTDRLIDWYPDGSRLLFASGREAGRQRFSQFFAVSPSGGLPERLPVPYGEFGALSPDGRSIAYMPKSRDFRTWKRYRGGWASDIWLFDLSSYDARNLTDDIAVDGQPMWHGRTLYFLSDRGSAQRPNIWAHGLDDGSFRQITHFADFDVTFPAIGPSDIVFQAGGRLFVMDLGTEQYVEVQIAVVTDRATLRPRTENVAGLIRGAAVSPSGQRAVFEARGEIFTVPAEHGVVRNLTRSSGVAERYPTWSPDARYVAYWSDRSGEYELMLRPAHGSGTERQVTRLGVGYRYRPQWSPDSKKIAFIDYMQQIRIYDVDADRITNVDRMRAQWIHGALEGFDVHWSADSRWFAYSKMLPHGQNAIFLYDVERDDVHQVTSGFYSDRSPVFDPDGDYLYYLTNRNLQPVFGDLDGTWVYPNSTRIVAVALRNDVESPLKPRSDDEEVAVEEEDEEGEDEDAGDDRLRIDLQEFERRLIVLPPAAGNYTDLAAVSGKVLYRRLPRAGASDRQSAIVYYDLGEREEKTVMRDADGFTVSADGEKLLVRNDRQYAIVDIGPDQKMETPLRTDELEATVEPLAEWRQMFQDTWRAYRDFFYDPNMHGVDWNGVRQQYGALIEDAVTRWDVTGVLGDVAAELSASHTYVFGGDTESAPRRGVGLLGVDWALERGAYRIARIVRGAPWDDEVRSPFDEPGVDVDEGDYILAVNGIPLDTANDPWTAFDGLAGRTVALTVNDRPTTDGARQVLVETLRSETRLRHLEWIQANRRRVEEASDGRLAYVYMPNTGGQGQTELIRQYYAQMDREGFIIDERFNSGGQLADRFLELLTRPVVAYLAPRSGDDIQYPAMANPGPKVMLINGWSVSGGDAFPWIFQNQHAGPVVGTRTTGALIGPVSRHALVDGGGISVPPARLFDPSGTWFAEGIGVDPDILVIEDPAQLARGVDPQLERAIEEALRLLRERPPHVVDRPEYQDRSVTDERAAGGGGK